MPTELLTALLAALGGGGLGAAAFKYLTQRGERGLRVKLTEHDWVTAEFAQLRTIWQLQDGRQTTRIEALESEMTALEKRNDKLENQIRDLRLENAVLRSEIVRLGGTPPPVRAARQIGDDSE